VVSSPGDNLGVGGEGMWARIDRRGRLPHQQGLSEARLGCQDGSPRLGARVRMYMPVQTRTQALGRLLFITAGPI
jgi:hypothetical protein